MGDQKLAGLIMWIPGGLLFAVLMEYSFGAWLRANEKRTRATHPEYAPMGDRHD
jgi:cytochrome c oxidase assembly factor CtaG